MKELYVKVQHGDDKSSYVFPLSDWRNKFDNFLDWFYGEP